MKRLLLTLLLLVVPLHAAAQDKPKPPEVKHPRGYKPLPPEKAKELHARKKAKYGAMLKALPKVTAPQWDCRTLGYVLPVDDQGGCGDCYGVSTMDCASMVLVKAGVLPNDPSKGRLSSQYGLDYRDCFQGGCDGGDEAQVADYLKQHGAPLTSDYGPYTASPARPKDVSGMKTYKITDWTYCDPGNQGVASTDSIKSAMVAFGPISIAASADGWDSYNGGVFSGRSHNIDHAILLVGWDDTKGKNGAWLLMNQWGASWGEKGLMWIEYGANDVGTEAFSMFATPVTPPAVPAITSTETAQATVGAAWFYQIQATNSPTSYGATGLPAGVTIDTAKGLISGTPTAAGVSTVALTATNANGVGHGALTVTVTNGPVPPVPPGPVPPAPGSVSITLTPDQVASVNQQSGATVISGTTTVQQIVDMINSQNGDTAINANMTLKEIMEAVGKNKKAPPGKAPCPCQQSPEPPKAKSPEKTDSGDAARLAKLEASNAEIRAALEAIMKALLDKKE